MTIQRHTLHKRNINVNTQRLLGLNQLLWYYADMEKKRCPTEMAYPPNANVTTDSNACIVWRRFAKYVVPIFLNKYLRAL